MNSKVNSRNVIDYQVVDHALDLLYPTFKTNGWVWRDAAETPTRLELENLIYELANELINGDGNATYISSGRIMVYWAEQDVIGIALTISEAYIGSEE